KAITDRIMDGAATPANQFLPDGMFGTLQPPPELKYDPAAASASCWPRPAIPTAATPSPARRWCCTTTP
ncbi:hypothetical protein LZB68_08700, partial [Campylobacter lari]|nr:hypothetical protein [Campylobacter lari]